MKDRDLKERDLNERDLKERDLEERDLKDPELTDRDLKLSIKIRNRVKNRHKKQLSYLHNHFLCLFYFV